MSCPLFLIVNYYRTDSWTGDKPFSAFTGQDWRLFALFMTEEILIVGIMLLFGFLARRMSKKQNAEMIARRETGKLFGIKPGDCDAVWFDLTNRKRALILKQGDRVKLYVQEYDEHTGSWEDIGGVRAYDDLEAVKKALLSEFDFHCAEADASDERDGEI